VSSPSNGIEYDEGVIRGFAQMMYSRASTITVFYTIGGILVGSAFLSFAGGAAGSFAAALFFGALVGGGFGYFVGNMKANALRLEAQVALCQVEIERNTRS